MKRMAAGVACTIVVVAGCSGASNSGGDTSCADFLGMRGDDQKATVAKLLKERNGRNSSTGDVVDEQTRLVEACGPDDVRDARIGDLR